MANLVYNAIRVWDGTILESRGRHDYNTYTDTNGSFFAVDGGLDYARRLGDSTLYTDISIYDDDKHEVVRKAFSWTSYGKDGRQPAKRQALEDMGLEHIQAILETQSHITPHMRELFEKELVYRVREND